VPDADRRNLAPTGPARSGARSLLREALATLAPLSGSRAYAVALEYQGDLALDLGNHVAALDSFTRLAARGEALCQKPISRAARGAARRTRCRTWRVPRMR
jgi:hypothetical protein